MNHSQEICVALYHLVKRYGSDVLRNRRDTCYVEMVCCSRMITFTFTDETEPDFFFMVRIDYASGKITTQDSQTDDQTE